MVSAVNKCLVRLRRNGVGLRVEETGLLEVIMCRPGTGSTLASCYTTLKYIRNYWAIQLKTAQPSTTLLFDNPTKAPEVRSSDSRPVKIFPIMAIIADVANWVISGLYVI